jgi:hypothetical protein
VHAGIGNKHLGVCLIVLIPLVLGILAQGSTYVYAQTATGKAIVIHPNYILNRASGTPSFSDLKKAGFTILGTIIEPGQSYDAQYWMAFKTWISSAKAAGFETMLDFWGDAPTALKLAKGAAATGADILALDELLSASHLTKTELLAVINGALQVNPKVSFIMNEYDVMPVENAYAWTVGYPVRVATDDYYNLNLIDFNIKAAQTYGKKPAAWLLFARGSQNFTCYTDLNTWISYVRQRPVDVFFWFIDPAGTWKANWQTVATF